MNKRKWTVGDTCVIEVKRYNGVRELHDATVVRVGREYMTAQYQTTYTPTYSADCKTRTHTHTLEAHMSTGWPRNTRSGHRSGEFRVWASRQAWRTAEVTGKLWHRIQDAVRRHSNCPEHLTEAQLREIAMLFNVSTADIPEAQ